MPKKWQTAGQDSEPLRPEEYAVGRRVTSPQGKDYDVSDTLVTTGTGNTILLLTDPDDGSVLVVPVERVRDMGWESVSEEDAQEAREQEAGDDVTDETDETVPNRPTPSPTRRSGSRPQRTGRKIGKPNGNQ